MSGTELPQLELPDIAHISGPFGEGMRRAFERLQKRVNEIGYDAWLTEYDTERRQRFTESEQKARARYVKRLLENSGLGDKFLNRTFDTFCASPTNRPAYDACKDVVSGKGIRGVILSGPHGIGKTHLAAAIVNAMAEIGKRAYFGNIVDIKSEVMDNFKAGTDRVINRFLDGDVIVIDDLGAEYLGDKHWVEELVYKITNRAYERAKKIVITTNMDERELTGRYGVRIVSRLHEMCDFISYEGEDARLDFEPTNEAMPF